MKENEKKKRENKKCTLIVMSYSITVCVPCTTTYKNLFSGGDIDSVMNELEAKIEKEDGYQYENILSVVKLAKDQGAVSIINGSVCKEYGITVCKCECVFCSFSKLQEFTESLKSFFEF